MQETKYPGDGGAGLRELTAGNSLCHVESRLQFPGCSEETVIQTKTLGSWKEVFNNPAGK